MIIYGSRMYGRRNLVKGWGHCDHCGKYVKNISYNGRKWGHLYFLPLIPLDPPVRVIKQCNSCSHGLHIEEDNVPGILEDMREQTDKALAALLAGEQEFEQDGNQIPCVAFLAGNVEMYYCLDEQKYTQLVLGALKQKELNFAYHLVHGELLEFEGKLVEAGQEYRQAAELQPEDELPLYSLGSILLKQNDYEGARSIYEKTLAMSEDKIVSLNILLGIYEKLKDFMMVTETYEAIAEKLPELAGDKKFMKDYKKMCKKAGKEPAIA